MILVFLVGLVIKQCRLKISNKSSRVLPSFGGLSGCERSALKSPAYNTVLVRVDVASNSDESS